MKEMKIVTWHPQVQGSNSTLLWLKSLFETEPTSLCPLIAFSKLKPIRRSGLIYALLWPQNTKTHLFFLIVLETGSR